MKRKRLLPAAWILLIFPGCAKYYHFDSGFPGNGDPAKCITLDNSYDYYIRQLYRSKETGRNEQKNFSEKGARDSLLEIEYLFISSIHNNVIYISTVPDKFQKYYADSTRYLGEQFVNIYDFKKFSFGILEDTNTFRFISKSGKESDAWNITSPGDSITLNTLEQTVGNRFVDLIPVNRALEKDIIFRKVTGPCTLLFYRNYKNQKDSSICSERKLCINQQGKKYEVFFHVDSKIDGADRFIYFYDNRIPYSPDTLFKK